jgi:hypothetical protein
MSAERLQRRAVDQAGRFGAPVLLVILLSDARLDADVAARLGAAGPMVVRA